MYILNFGTLLSYTFIPTIFMKLIKMFLLKAINIDARVIDQYHWLNPNAKM